MRSNAKGMPVLRLCPSLVGFIGIAPAAAEGCSRPSGPDYPVIRGRALSEGRPLAGGDIRLTSTVDATVDASGPIDVSGRFRLVFKTPVRPLPPGRYEVAVASWLEKPGVERPDGTFSKGVSAIPLAYRDRLTSGLSVDVTPETMHSVTIELPFGRDTR